MHGSQSNLPMLTRQFESGHGCSADTRVQIIAKRTVTLLRWLVVSGVELRFCTRCLVLSLPLFGLLVL
jgi:hypothetical protein